MSRFHRIHLNKYFNLILENKKDIDDNVVSSYIQRKCLYAFIYLKWRQTTGCPDYKSNIKRNSIENKLHI